jgi:hypothetical protein
MEEAECVYLKRKESRKGRCDLSVVRSQRPIVDGDALRSDEVRVGRSGPLGVEEDLKRVGSAVHVDGKNLGVAIVLVGDLILRLGRDRRVGLAVIR